MNPRKSTSCSLWLMPHRQWVTSLWVWGPIIHWTYANIVLLAENRQNQRDYVTIGLSFGLSYCFKNRCISGWNPLWLDRNVWGYNKKFLEYTSLKVFEVPKTNFTLQIHFFPLCKHLLTASTAGTCGVVMLLSSLCRVRNDNRLE